MAKRRRRAEKTVCATFALGVCIRLAPRHVLALLSGPGGQLELRASKVLSTTDIAPLRHGRFAAALSDDAFNQPPRPPDTTPLRSRPELSFRKPLSTSTRIPCFHSRISASFCARRVSFSGSIRPGHPSSNFHLSSHAILPQNLDSPLHRLPDV